MNNSAARANILQRLRKETPPGLPLSGEGRSCTLVADASCSSPDKGRLGGVSSFDWDKAERVRRFTERMQAVRAEIHHADRHNWLEVLVEICQAKGLNNLLLSPNTAWGQTITAQAERFPSLRHYDQPIDDWKEEMFYGIDAAFTATRGGIAETGTLILWPDAEEPRQMSLVPPIHIAVLETDQLYTTFAAAVQKQGWVETGLPTNALLVSGPSKSADIEQTLAYGVHGPKELVVILV
ncbi:MAG: lactate utilization protein [Gammaproteobacteria bacterium]|nr:lactate utilization protein [Gammaproteobacteria bacterium]MBU1722269.1 lactate utilization protein [Gammaproteobacteria bacterium]MBU2005376.1 lactate utilization protein [Gammaproteobacteria bacterium]